MLPLVRRGLLAQQLQQQQQRLQRNVRCLSSAAPRKFRVLGLQQIAIGSTDKKELSKLWVELFGLEKTGEFRSEKENVDEDILRLGPKGPFQVEVDIMAPLDVNKSPKVWIPQLNHIGECAAGEQRERWKADRRFSDAGLWVDDIQAAVKDLTEKVGVANASTCWSF